MYCRFRAWQRGGENTGRIGSPILLITHGNMFHPTFPLSPTQATISDSTDGDVFSGFVLEGGMKVRVVCYEGYKAEETPRAFLLGERRVEVVRVLDRWRGEDHEYVKLDGSDGALYILRYDRSRDEWEIQMMESSPPMTGR